ncbi:MAG: LptF/LptG family permease [Spirochaetia bacterium]
MKRRYWVLYSYVGREFTLSFLVAFLFFFFIFFVNQILLLAENILSKRVPFTDVLLLIFYSLPLILSLSIPFGTLVGALMAVGRFSSDNEMLAFQASGIPKGRVFVPIFFIAVIFSFLSFVMNDVFLPIGTINFGRLYRKLLYSNPEIELEPYSIKRYQDSILVTGAIEEGVIEDLMIIDKTPENDRRIITAGRAELVESAQQQGVISLHLDTVFSHTVDLKRKNLSEYISAERMIYNILLRDITFSLRNPGPSEMSSKDVLEEIREMESVLERKRRLHRQNLQEKKWELLLRYREAGTLGLFPDKADISRMSALREEIERGSTRRIDDRSLHLYELEFHKKLAVPLSCFIFVVFAFPVGLFTKRSGRSVGFGLGLLVAALYWGMLFAGQTLGLRVMFSPILSMWLPNIVILTGGAIAFTVRGRR